MTAPVIEELWAPIPNFPLYQVSSLGWVVNINSGRFLSQSMNKTGVVKVGLVNTIGVQVSKSVKLLVADAFVPGKTEEFNTAIHLDGFTEHNEANNLRWRPRWFAWKYGVQFSRPQVYFSEGPLYDGGTSERYNDIYEAGVRNGLLFHDIWLSVHTKKPVFPTWQQFALL